MFRVFIIAVLLSLLVYGSLIIGYFAGYRDGHFKGLSDGAILDAKFENKIIKDLQSNFYKESKTDGKDKKLCK
ncbi:MAG: hypothetical protein MSS83_00300 [Methanobrevibacter sp.]|uniref:hypothetical protein n=1 Tax=Methanobrevibacter sp. TaxID=66852 RepID=UPI0031F501B4|nr:hypothetical protein [Methanobrevibacter sp.]